MLTRTRGCFISKMTECQQFLFTLYQVRSVQTCVLKSGSTFEMFIMFQGHFGPYILPYIVDDNPK